MDSKEKFIFPLWKTESGEYLPIISRTDDKKVFETNELTWADVGFDESGFLDRKMNHAYQFQTNIEKIYQATLEAIQSRNNDGTTSCIPVVPKTPIPLRRKMGIRKSKKPRVSCLAVRRSTRNRKSVVNTIKDFKTSVCNVSVIDLAATSSPDLNTQTVSNEAAVEVDLPCPDIFSKNEGFELKAKKKRNTETKVQPRLKTVRRTRQGSRLSTERRSVLSQSSVLSQDSLDEINEDIVDDTETIPTASSEVAKGHELPSLENKDSSEDRSAEEPMSNDEVTSAATQLSPENACKKLSIELRRLSNEDIAMATAASAGNTSLPEEPEKETCKKSEERICLFLSDSSTVDDMDEVPEIPTVSANRESKRVSRKRSHALLDGLAAKRRSIRKSIHASAKHQKQVSTFVNLCDESTPKTDSSCDEPKSKRPKPRIAKPVIKKNISKKKSFISSGKKTASAARIVPKSATPVRTRSKFVSSLLHTPSSAQMSSTVKSFLVRNTPEKVNQEAVMEAKKKLLEEKQKQGEERQRKLEEQKKQRLAEEKRKREERIQRVNKMREQREKEEKERQDQLQGKWEERIAVAGRTKELKKIETTAKVTREMEKIAKAEAKRKEEEEEKRKRLLELKQEREKRLLQQQTEKRLLEEQRIREKQIEEEQRKAEEERLKEEKMRLLAQQEEERIKKAEAAALKKQEEEAKRKKHKERMEKMKKKAELKREEMRKRNLERKEREEQRKLEEKKEREEKLRLEREKAEAEREEMLRIRKEEAEKQKMLQLAQEREARKLEAARKKEEIRKRVEERRRLQEEKLREAEEQRKRIEKEQEYLRKIEEAKKKLQILSEEKATSSKTANTSTLDSTYVKDDSVVNYDMTPRGADKQLIPSTATNYNIDDFCSDDSTDDESRPKKVVPKWAKGALLHTAIFQQCTYPPDLDKIFPRALNTVDLASMFKVRKERYFKRTSSAIWNSPIMPPSHISFSEHCKGF